MILLVLCAAGAHRLSINADTRVFFSTGNENRKALDLFERRYASNVNLLIALHAEKGDLFTDERLVAIEALTEEAWRLPYATRVESIVNAVHVSSDQEGIIISESAALGAAGNVEEAKRRALTDNLLLNRLISPDGKTTGINVTVQYPLESSSATNEILEAAKLLVAKTGIQDQGVVAWYGGRVASSNAFSQASRNDLITLIPLTFASFLLLLGILFRSFVLAGALFTTTVFAAASTMGVAGWFGVQINAATAHVPTVILALGVASLAHLAVSTRRNIRRGDHQEDAVTKALRTDAKPIALTLCTTCVGFLTLTAADAPPFRQLGMLVAAGALFCLFYGLVLLPALLRLISFRVQEAPSFIADGVNLAGEIVVNQRRPLCIVLPVAAGLAILGISQITIDDTFPKYFNEQFEFRQHADLIEAHLTGLEVVDFDIGAPLANGIFDAAYVSKIQEFEEWILQQPKTVHVNSVLEVYRRLNQHLNDGDVANYFVPTEREKLAQYTLLYEMSLPLGQELTNTITIDKSRSRVTAVLRDASTADVRSFKEKAEVWLSTTESTDVQGSGTGLAVMFSYLSSLNVRSMLGGTAIALVMISGILVFAFRSLRYGVMSLIPNLMPGAIAFGLWGYFVGEIGVAVSVVGAMALGIIVDDTIHIIFRYREARRRGIAPNVAVLEMFDKVGEPMLISSLVLIVGFTLLALSGFHITSSTGKLVAATIFFALVLDWFFLAPLLVVVDSWVEGRKPAHATHPPLILVPDEKEAEPEPEQKDTIASM